MKYCIVLLSLAALVTSETYNTNNDNVDVEAIVSDLATLQSFLDCFLDRQPCNEQQADFKKDLQEVFQQACAKCTDSQKYLLRRFIEGLKEKIPVGYTDFKNKYDPNGNYYKPLEAAIANP